MRIQNSFSTISTYRTKQRTPNFQGLIFKKNPIADIFQRRSSELTKITRIRPGKHGGTICNGSLPLENFWNKFGKEKEQLLEMGLSTNADGFAYSFLKTKSDIPISTSFIHDCSAMYLYNDKTNTHMLYHAAPDIKKHTLGKVIEVLMPEGFSKGVIIPGASKFYETHKFNLHNMFELMNSGSRNSKIEVRHSSSPFPEVVGYQGNVYEIPNKVIIWQKQHGFKEYCDYGQASFKIIDMQHYNTFDTIKYNIFNVQDGEYMKNTFKERAYPKETLDVLDSLIDAKLLNTKENNSLFEDLNYY